MQGKSAQAAGPHGFCWHSVQAVIVAGSLVLS